ncbi:hypothetical protein L3Q82_021580%2C partial [Xyrichtys novacula]|uniref:Uncharacterized protein n=1 Tax=Xyrichtys novacula TaxID=13765 RepID=A0AAV1GH16_XYRNO|nr:hypothetical protein L3Q82_021580%2C partial [Xyrichtys novacula]
MGSSQIGHRVAVLLFTDLDAPTLELNKLHLRLIHSMLKTNPCKAAVMLALELLTCLFIPAMAQTETLNPHSEQGFCDWPVFISTRSQCHLGQWSPVRSRSQQAEPLFGSACLSPVQSTPVQSICHTSQLHRQTESYCTDSPTGITHTQVKNILTKLTSEPRRANTGTTVFTEDDNTGSDAERQVKYLKAAVAQRTSLLLLLLTGELEQAVKEKICCSRLEFFTKQANISDLKEERAAVMVN